MIEGLGYSGRIIGAAALVMISVFGSFVLNDDPVIKQFGLGLATAVAIDAIVVCIFVPAVITLAGRRTLWFPRWLDRIVPHISIEGEGYFDDKAGSRRRCAIRPGAGSKSLNLGERLVLQALRAGQQNSPHTTKAMSSTTPGHDV